MARSKQSELVQKYNRERRRIQRQINRMEKRGYMVDSSALPKKPKRITPASVSRLEKITTPKLYQRSRAVIEETGEIITGEEARRIERSNAAKKAAQARKKKRRDKIAPSDTHSNTKREPISFAKMIISNFRSEINQFPQVAGPLFNRWLDMLLSQYSEDDVAQMLEDGKSAGYFPDRTIAYSEDKLLDAIAGFMEYLPDASEGFKQEIAEAVEFGEDWEEPL